MQFNFIVVLKGFPIQPHNNPADFFLDILMGAEIRKAEAGAADENLADLYGKSSIKSDVNVKLDTLWQRLENDNGSDTPAVIGYKTSFGRQVTEEAAFLPTHFFT